MPVPIEEIDRATSICFSALASKEGLTPRKLIREIKEIALSNIENHIAIDDSGAVIPRHFGPIKGGGMGKHSAAVKKIKEKTVITESKDGEKIYKTSTVECELHDKLDAIDKAMTIHGMKIKKIEGKLTGTFIVDTGIRRPMDDTGEEEIAEPGPSSQATMTGIER